MKNEDLREEYRKLAAVLGLEYKEGVETFLESPSLRLAAGEALQTKDIQQAEKFLTNPLVKSLLAKVFMGAATGFYRDFEVALFRGTSSGSESSSQTYYVNISLFFKSNLRCGLQIYHKDFFTRLGAIIFSGSYVKLPGDAPVSKLIAVKAEDKTQAQMYVSSRELLNQIHQLFQYSPDFKITDHGIRYRQRGHIIDPAQARPIMDLMVDTARKFGAG